MPAPTDSRPWTNELIPELPEDPSRLELLTYIACAMRRQLEITMPDGAEIVDGVLHLP